MERGERRSRGGKRGKVIREGLCKGRGQKIKMEEKRRRRRRRGEDWEEERRREGRREEEREGTGGGEERRGGEQRKTMGRREGKEGLEERR